MESAAGPDPLETVHVLKSDFDLLQAAANAAMEDFTTLCTLLGVRPDPEDAPRAIMHEVLLPRIAQLVATQQHVDEASTQLTAAAARFGHKTIDSGLGKAVKVGQRIAGGLPGLQPASRSERRRLERERRHG